MYKDFVRQLKEGDMGVYGIAVLGFFSYGIAVLGTPQCPPPEGVSAVLLSFMCLRNVPGVGAFDHLNGP